jgi:hypothetical protein
MGVRIDPTSRLLDVVGVDRQTESLELLNDLRKVALGVGRDLLSFTRKERRALIIQEKLHESLDTLKLRLDTVALRHDDHLVVGVLG